MHLIPTYLPPTNEVWGKLIFSQASVCPQGERLSWTETPPPGKERAVRILRECILVFQCLWSELKKKIGGHKFLWLDVSITGISIPYPTLLVEHFLRHQIFLAPCRQQLGHLVRGELHCAYLPALGIYKMHLGVFLLPEKNISDENTKHVYLPENDQMCLLLFKK